MPTELTVTTPLTCAGTIRAPSTERFGMGVESVGESLSVIGWSMSTPRSPAPAITASPLDWAR